MDTTCNIQQCWELLANNVVSVCTDGNRIVLKAIGLKSRQQQIFAHVSPLFVHFFTVVPRFLEDSADREHTTTIFIFL